MKYVISDKGEVNIGNMMHASLAENFEGKVISAGHCERKEDGTYHVFGSSIGYSMYSKPQDATILNDYQSKQVAI